MTKHSWFRVTSVVFNLYCSSLVTASDRPPNIVILVADDVGIGDLGCYGNDTIKTPNIDRLASEGVRLVHHVTAAAYCTPSRAALLTGRYPVRFGLTGTVDTTAVIMHIASRVQLPFEEITIAEALQTSNYSTAITGKWHLGSGCGWFGTGCRGPLDHGFQSFYGLPFSLIQELHGDHPFWIFDIHDHFYQGIIAISVVTIFFALISVLFYIRRINSNKFKGKSSCFTFTLISSLCICVAAIFLAWFLRSHYRFHTKRWWQISPWMIQHMDGVLMHNDVVVEQPLVLDGLEQRMAKYSLDFINQHLTSDRPFFLYHGFGHAHTPMFTAPHMINHSVHGRYGDNIEEMDEVVGSILDAIDRNNITENTIVYFLSDHGGHLESISPVDGQREGGYNDLYKGGKGQGDAEGGIRVPGLMRWTGHLPAGKQLTLPTSTLDILPTMLQLAGLPALNLTASGSKHELDGISLAKILLTNSSDSDHLLTDSRVLIHHCEDAIQALRIVMDGQIFKMHLVRRNWGVNTTQCGWGHNSYCPCYGDDVIDISETPDLFNLSVDPYEDAPLSTNSTEYKTVTSFLKSYLSDWRQNVVYIPSQLTSKWNTMHSMWLQPFQSQDDI